MATPVTNFGKVTVSTGYTSAATSIVLSTGHGSRLPATFPYPLAWWEATTYSDPSDDPNRELVLVTNRTGDTLTVTRGQEGTSASNKNTASKTYKMLLGITKAMWEQVGELALSEDFRNLQLQVHTDSDKKLRAVRLVHADAIVMDDGEEVANWDDLDFDITAAPGIGGLDTGTEQASTWYQIIAGRNPITDARGIYGHRAKDYFLDEDSSSGEDASQGLRSNVDNSTVKIGQGFKVDTAGPVEFLDIKLLKTGTPTGNYWVTIETNSGGVPSGTAVATSDKHDASRLRTASQWVRIVFRTPASLSAATQYHLVLQGDYAVSASNFLSWRMDGSAGTYANGSKALFDSDTSTWTTDTDDDMMFKVYVTENNTAITKPTGYTQSARIGWAYNNSASDLVSFRQRDRHWDYHNINDGLLVNEMSGTTDLIDLRTALPPMTVAASFSLSGTGAATAVGAMADLKGTDTSSAVGGPYTVALRNEGVTEHAAYQAKLVLEYNAVVLDGTAGADFYCNGFDW